MGCTGKSSTVMSPAEVLAPAPLPELHADRGNTRAMSTKALPRIRFAFILTLPVVRLTGPFIGPLLVLAPVVTTAPRSQRGTRSNPSRPPRRRSVAATATARRANVGEMTCEPGGLGDFRVGRRMRPPTLPPALAVAVSIPSSRPTTRGRTGRFRPCGLSRGSVRHSGRYADSSPPL